MKDSINYIIYNNRSQELVKKFLPKVNLIGFLELEKRYSFFHKMFKSPYSFEIEDSLLNLDYKDIIYDGNDINSLKDKILESSKKFKNSEEFDYLIKRNIPINLIEKYKLACLSFGWDNKDMDVLGASLHPLINNLIENDISKGIILPLFDKSGNIINFAIRRMMNGPIKYTLSVPDVNIWGIDDIDNGDEIWICEGIFDHFALREQGFKSVTVSSASWSSIQVYSLISKNPKLINIFSDYDYTGLRSSLVLKKLLNLYNIDTKIWISNKCKDPCEHFFERSLGVDDIEEIAVTKDLLEYLEPDEEERMMDYLSYLKRRKI